MPREQDYQNALMVALSGSGRVVVWRQPAGMLPAARGGVVKAAPVGAADLCGVVMGEGRLLQVECKGPSTRETPEQTRWAEHVRAWGGVHALVRAKRGETLEAFAKRATHEVLAAIDAPAGGHGAR
jgi:hypothetical protein